MQVWNVLHGACWKYRMQKSHKNRHLGTIAQLCRLYLLQLRYVLTVGRNLLNSNISSTCTHNMANVGPLTAHIDLGVWGTPANFNGFRVLPLLLQQRHSSEANQTLHDVWPSHGLVHYVYIFVGSWSLTEFFPLQNSLYDLVLHSPILEVLLHGTPAAGISQTVEWYKKWNYGTFAEAATYIRLRDHHVGHWPTFWLIKICHHCKH